MRAVENEAVVGEFVPEHLSFDMRNSEASSISFEIPLSATGLRRDLFAPYRTDWELWRRGTGPGAYQLLEGGLLTEVNLASDRDSVLVNGKSWLHYLEKRVYPFDPVAYVEDRDWASWPKQWGLGDPSGEDLRIIVEDILEAMTDESNTPQIIFNNLNTGVYFHYKIFPADPTTIYEHIRKLSEVEDGFEFAILPGSLEFKMYPPTRDVGIAIYAFEPSENEFDGAVTNADWTNSGPAATVTVGYGSGSKFKKGFISTHIPSQEQYRRLERTVDFGDQIASQPMLNSLAASQGYQDRFPQKKLSLTILNPEFQPVNFYTGGRPRSLIGNRIAFRHDWTPYHLVNADFRIISMNWDVDQSGNEEVEFELEMINE